MHDLYVAVKSFEAKLVLLSVQLNKNKLTHFPHLQTQTQTQPAAERYSKQRSSLKEEFAEDCSELWTNTLTCDLPI